MSSLGFVIEDRGHCRCVVWDNGGVSPATLAECALWDALHTQPPAVGVDVSEEMVDRGWIAATTACVEVIDGEHTYVAPVSPEQWDRAIRAALHAALRTGGGA